MNASGRGQCSHAYSHDKIGDTEETPRIGGAVSTRSLAGEHAGHDHGKDTGCDVADPSGQSKLPWQVSSRPKHEKDTQPRQASDNPSHMRLYR